MNMEIFNKYFDHLAATPERIDGLLMWTVCTAFVWFWIIKYRERAIKGMEGSNLFWEGHEQVIYWGLMSVWPVVFKAAFVSDVPTAVWYFEFGLISIALLGRSALDYALAFFGRTPVKTEPKEETKPQ